MKRQITASMLSVALLGLPVLVGCDDTIASKETTKTSSDGTEVRSTTEVKERPDGSIVKEESKTKTNVD